MKREEVILKLAEMLLLEKTETTNINTSNNNLDDYMKGKYCIFRTCSSGVHVGYLKKKCGQSVIIENARRLWSWEGAFTLNKVAKDGFKDAKMPVAVEEIQIEQVIEIIPVCLEIKEKFESWSVHNE